MGSMCMNNGVGPTGPLGLGPTSGGTAKGAPCAFPFTYKGKSYNKCTTDGHHRMWCRSAGNKLWGHCQCAGAQSMCSNAGVGPTGPTGLGRTYGGNARGAPCAFPFTYNKKSYNKCTMAGHSRMWCRSAGNKLWGNCACDSTKSTSPSRRYSPNFQCSDDGDGPEGPADLGPTFGGDGGGTPCQFPFTYNGASYSKCIKTNHDRMWCRVDGKKWGNCKCRRNEPVVKTCRLAMQLPQHKHLPWRCSKTDPYDVKLTKGSQAFWDCRSKHWDRSIKSYATVDLTTCGTDGSCFFRRVTRTDGTRSHRNPHGVVIDGKMVSYRFADGKTDTAPVRDWTSGACCRRKANIHVSSTDPQNVCMFAPGSAAVDSHLSAMGFSANGNIWCDATFQTTPGAATGRHYPQARVNRQITFAQVGEYEATRCASKYTKD